MWQDVRRQWSFATMTFFFGYQQQNAAFQGMEIPSNLWPWDSLQYTNMTSLPVWLTTHHAVWIWQGGHICIVYGVPGSKVARCLHALSWKSIWSVIIAFTNLVEKYARRIWRSFQLSLDCWRIASKIYEHIYIYI